MSRQAAGQVERASGVARRSVVVAGATGLVGRAAVALLAGDPSVRVFALVRRPREGVGAGHADAPDVREVRFDFESDASYAKLGDEVPCDVLLCCLGTTRAKAGSDEAFRRVDLVYPSRLVERLASLARPPVFGLVSSVGASTGKGLYLATKAEIERRVLASGLPHVIVRPSLLVGDRSESRPLERAASAIFTPLGRLAQAVARVDAIDRYAPIEAAAVARALVTSALAAGPSSALVLEGSSLVDAARSPST